MQYRLYVSKTCIIHSHPFIYSHFLNCSPRPLQSPANVGGQKLLPLRLRLLPLLHRPWAASPLSLLVPIMRSAAIIATTRVRILRLHATRTYSYQRGYNMSLGIYSFERERPKSDRKRVGPTRQNCSLIYGRILSSLHRLHVITLATSGI